MARDDIVLMAHLMRRAGFGSSYGELETLAAKGYEATIEDLLYPENQPDMDLDIIHRYFVDMKDLLSVQTNQQYWVYRMINTKSPLEEKMALFWHGILCTGDNKCANARQVQVQLDLFRRNGLGSFPNLLLELSKDPAMIFYLDNCMSHKDAPNENYGRELLELFSMGAGMDTHANYTEEDVKACAKAFTGWTLTNRIPNYPYGQYESYFVYNPADHDDSEKTFLGETGRFNGEDIVEITARQPATARFLARHLYNYFVADETPVPYWQGTPARDPAAIETLEKAYFDSNYDVRSMLRVLFNSDFFKNARFAKIKSPAETVVGTIRLVGDFTYPKPGLFAIMQEVIYMGQDLMNPPTVEGWHTGKEWIDSGTLVERINFVADQVGNVDQPGIRSIIQRLRSEGATVTPERLVDGCLQLLGGYQLAKETKSRLVEHVGKKGDLKTGTDEFAQRVGQTLQLIVATQEYQFA